VDWEKRFTFYGKVAHYVTTNLFDADVLMTRCGLSGHSQYWYGTGSQDEYDTVTKMAICRKCQVAEGEANEKGS